MKAEDKNQIVIGVATKATIMYLEEHPDKQPITKINLFPAISRISGYLMQDSDDTIYDDEAIAPPDEKFLGRHWKTIKLQAASEHKRYIIPDTNGFKLGTLEEWCRITPEKDMPIVVGIAKSAARRSRIAQSQGASSPLIQSKLKQLPSNIKQP